MVGPELVVDWRAADGDAVAPGRDPHGGDAVRCGPILTAERTALNFLGRLSGVATLTAQVRRRRARAQPAVQILDTRKTTPGLRVLEKAAVRAGGGTNHRAGLSDAVLVKDNHLAGTTITEAVHAARARWPGRLVEIECDTLDQVAEAATAGADARAARQHGSRHGRRGHRAWPHHDAAGPILTEVSGGVTLETVGDYAAAGPDRISVGALTHSAPVLDLGLDLVCDRLGRSGDVRQATAGRRNEPAREEGESAVLLVIDVGNTETVIGLYTRDDTDTVPVVEEGVGVGIGTERDPTAPAGLTHHWRLSTVPSRTPDEHAVLLTQLLDLEGLDIASSVSGIAVSSSVPHVTGGAAPDGDPLVRRRALRGARARHQERDADPLRQPQGGRRRPHRRRRRRLRPLRRPLRGRRHGHRDDGRGHQRQGRVPRWGAITPGVAISLDALYQQAAALRRVELVEPRSVIGRSTVESIESGTLYGFAGLVDGLARRFMEELGPSTVVATGGFSSLIAPYSDTIEHVEPWLTLHGLRIVYERNVIVTACGPCA